MMLSDLIAQKDRELNEEQTKHALILPVLQQILGWNIFDAGKVIPEFTADAPGKAGERVDYALDYEGDGSPEILIEAKPLNAPLRTAQASQLFRYFTATDATIGILTDGYVWKLFSDLDKTNIMDGEPFLEFNLEDLANNRQLMKLFKTLSYEEFDMVKLRSWAEVKRDEARLEKIVAEELENPSDDLVRAFWKKLNPGSSLTTSRFLPFKEKLIQVIRGQEVESKPALAMIEEISQEAEVREKRAVAKGKVVDRFGNVFEDVNLKQAYIKYWKALVNDPEGEAMVRALMASGERSFSSKPRLGRDGNPLSVELIPDIHLYVNVSKLAREQQLESLSEKLDLGAKIIYDEEVNEESQ